MADFSNIKVGDKIKYYPRFWATTEFCNRY